MDSRTDVGFAPELREDELSVIFSNQSLSAKDLLSFRLVNKIWCNSATSTLLQRDACYIFLECKKSPAVKSGVSYVSVNKKLIPVPFFGTKGEKRGSPTELTDVLSMSQKFPARSLHIYAHTRCNIADCSHTDVDYCRLDYAHYPDLLVFFKLHGNKITTISPHGFICLEPLFNFLSIYTPNLECLDLSRARYRGLKNREEENDHSAKKWTLKYLPVKSLNIGYCFENNLRGRIILLLLSSLPKLSSIGNVTILDLPDIMREGKGHLIRGLKILILNDPQLRHSELQEFAGLHPKLFKLNLWLTLSTLNSLNKLLESSKDTLQQLDLFIFASHGQNKIKIFPMKNLKIVILRMRPYTINGQLDNEDQAWSIFEDGMFAPKCFPNLTQLSLIGDIFDVEKTIMRLFQFKLDRNGSVKNCLPKVEVLKSNSRQSRNSQASLIPKFFPNLRVFKTMGNSRGVTLSQSSWTESLSYLALRAVPMLFMVLLACYFTYD